MEYDLLDEEEEQLLPTSPEEDDYKAGGISPSLPAYDSGTSAPGGSPDDILRERFARADQRANENRLFARLGQAASGIGVAIAGADKQDQKPWEDMIASSDAPVKSLEKRVGLENSQNKILRDYLARRGMIKSREEQGDKNRAQSEKNAGIRANNMPTDRHLGLEERTTVTSLASRNAAKASIAAAVDSLLKVWPTLTEPQKIQQGNQILKTLNSLEGPDALSAPEADRLKGKLNIGMGGLISGNTGQFGRDLEGFASDAKITSDNIKRSTQETQKIIESASGRKSGVKLPKPSGERLSKTQTSSTGKKRTLYSDDGGKTWQP